MRIEKKFITFLFIFLLSLTVPFSHAQTINWESYVSSIHVKDFAWEGSKLWVASKGGGLVSIDMILGNSTVYHKTNSSIGTVFLTSVIVDNTGIKWMGSDDGFSGLITFDGSTWNNYTTQNSSLPNDKVLSLFYDDSGTIWVGTMQGLLRIHNNNWTVYTDPFFMNVVGIEQDLNGNIWFACHFSGVAKFDGNSFTYYNPASTGGYHIQLAKDITVDSAGQVWVLCHDHGYSSSVNELLLFNNQTWQSINIPSSVPNQATSMSNVHSIEGGEQGKLWFGACDEQSCGYFDGQSYHDITLPFLGVSEDQHLIQKIKTDAYGKIWYGGYGGIAYWDTCWHDLSARLISSIHAPGILDLAFNSVNGQIYASTANKGGFDYGNTPPVHWGTGRGLSIKNGGNWLNYYNGNSAIPLNTIGAIDFETNGTSWFTSYELLSTLNPSPIGHVVKFDGVQFYDYSSQNSGLSNDLYNAQTVDDSGKVVVGGYNKISSFDGSGWSLLYQFPSYHRIEAIDSDLPNSYWFGTQSLLHHLINGTLYSYNSSNSLFPGNHINDIYIDHYKNKWFATDGGLLLIDYKNDWSVYNTLNSGLPSDSLSALALDSTGKLWIGTYCKGVARWDFDTLWDYYTTLNSDLNDDRISCLAVSQSNDIWIGTSFGGISVLLNNTTAIIDPVCPSQHHTTFTGVYPNPFSQSATINIYSEEADEIELTICNIYGQCLKTLFSCSSQAGHHQISWDGSDQCGNSLPGGLYFCHLVSRTCCTSKPIILLK